MFDLLEFAFRFMCLSPQFGFEQLKGKARSIVLTSGTLKPFEAFETPSSLNLKFDVKFSCGHIINPEKQLRVSIVSKLK